MKTRERDTDTRMYICRKCHAYDYCEVYILRSGQIDEEATDNAPESENIGYCRDCGPDPVEGF
jgi:hypothetical protein